MTIAVCHPERRARSRGLCSACYQSRGKGGEFAGGTVLCDCLGYVVTDSLGECPDCHRLRWEQRVQ